MASPNIKQRIKDQPADEQVNPDDSTTQEKISNGKNTRSRRAKKLAMARRGLRSLGLAIGLPFLLTTLTIYLFQLGPGYDDLVSSHWYPPVWLVHTAALLSSSLMGLSAWLVWADGGFHQPATALPLFLTQLVLGLLWGPIVFAAGATRFGMVLGVVLVGALYGCMMGSREVNPIAGDLVKPCIAWALFLLVLNYSLI